MKCNGKYDDCGERCPECSRFMDDCNGHDDFHENADGKWVNFYQEDVDSVPVGSEAHRHAVNRLSTKCRHTNDNIRYMAGRVGE